jgi:methylenetetrahydrofolate--tRNA-(uracil-5-)-methyltransferase
VFSAGQISGVEGYTESTAIGLLAGRLAHAKLNGTHFELPPSSTVLGSLHAYVTKGVIGPFQPMNANFGLLPKITKEDIKKTGRKRLGKRDRRELQCLRVKEKFDAYFQAHVQPNVASSDSIFSPQAQA